MSQPWQPQHSGEPQLPPQQYAPQQPTYAPPPARRSQGLAITALVVGVIGAVVAVTPLGGVGLVVGLIAVVLAVVALIAKSQGGKMFAAGGLAAGLAAFPIAVILYGIRADQAQGNQGAVDCMTEAMERGASTDEIMACN